jgi:hypothetical protein
MNWYDLVSVNPWSPRGIRIYGTAQIVEHAGHVGRSMYLRITPTISWSWNIEPAVEAGFPASKSVHEAGRGHGGAI